MQRAPSSICRELSRNGWHNPATVPKKPGRPLIAGGYRAPQAQHCADALASTARRPSRLAFDGSLWEQVERLLRKQHSPEQIAGILRRMHPDQPSLQVSHETIYTHRSLRDATRHFAQRTDHVMPARANSEAWSKEGCRGWGAERVCRAKPWSVRACPKLKVQSPD